MDGRGKEEEEEEEGDKLSIDKLAWRRDGRREGKLAWAGGRKKRKRRDLRLRGEISKTCGGRSGRGAWARGRRVDFGAGGGLSEKT